MSGHYILDGHKAVLCDLMTWARWLEQNQASRKVARTDISPGVFVSTVFLGLDHNYGDGEPHIFETMVFGGDSDGDMERCATWEQAERQHAEMCRAALSRASGQKKGDEA